MKIDRLPTANHRCPITDKKIIVNIEIHQNNFEYSNSTLSCYTYVFYSCISCIGSCIPFPTIDYLITVLHSTFTISPPPANIALNISIVVRSIISFKYLKLNEMYG